MSENRSSIFVPDDPKALARHEVADDFVAAVMQDSPDLDQTLPLPQARIIELAEKHELPLGSAAALAYLSKHAVMELRSEIRRIIGEF